MQSWHYFPKFKKKINGQSSKGKIQLPSELTHQMNACPSENPNQMSLGGEVNIFSKQKEIKFVEDENTAHSSPKHLSSGWHHRLNGHEFE